jgi:glycosyltransferase involved in cell wall biosynthesis
MTGSTAEVLAARRERKFRILMISREHPFPSASGAAQRSAIMCQALSTFAEVDLFVIGEHESQNKVSSENIKLAGSISLQSEDLQPYPILGRMSSRLAKVGLAFSPRYGFHSSPRVAAAVHDAIGKGGYDIIVARYLTTFSQCALAGSGRIIVDIDDLPSQAFATMIVDKQRNPLLKAFRRSQQFRIARHTRTLVRQCHHVWLPNAGQVSMFPNASWLPNIPYPFDRHPTQPKPASTNSRRVLFVGLMKYLPNQEAMDFYVKQVWPKVVQAIPGAELRIVGGGLPPHLKLEWERLRCVSVAGYVESLAPEYENCALAVAPIFSGGGTNIKVIEAMSHARPCLLSASAAGGFGAMLQDGVNALVASTADEFAEKTIRLLSDTAMRQQIGEAGFRSIQKSYSYEAICKEVGSTLEAVMNKR